MNKTKTIPEIIREEACTTWMFNLCQDYLTDNLNLIELVQEVQFRLYKEYRLSEKTMDHIVITMITTSISGFLMADESQFPAYKGHLDARH